MPRAESQALPVALIADLTLGPPLEDEAIRKKCLEVVEEAKGRTVQDMEERRKALKRQVRLFR